MRIKTLFSIPDGEKVTEKALRRVLISSICSILLCMACLVSTTWAWFAVSIENTGNVIQIGMPKVKLTVNGSAFESGKELQSGENKIRIEHANELDDLQKKSTLYVTFSVGNEVQGYVVLDGNNDYATSITIENDINCPLSWTASWFKPNANPLTGNAINLINKEPDSTDGTAESTETAVPTGTATPPGTSPTESNPTETTATTDPSVEANGSTA